MQAGIPHGGNDEVAEEKGREPHGFRAGWSRDHSARLHMILPWIDSLCMAEIKMMTIKTPQTEYTEREKRRKEKKNVVDGRIPVPRDNTG